ncbi:MAG: 50S ribosomal protein L9 [Deltaproteobacteria bacterium]|nr:50S ribosomal protein L9 [Deltaproteobacteria bacterium]
MEVILREDVQHLGHIGDIVKVRPGYARNYLIPRGLATLADRRNLAALEHEKRIVDEKRKRAMSAAEAVVKKLGATKVTIAARAGEEGKLFGSVTNMDIERALAEAGVPVERRRIRLDEPIKTLGEHKVSVTLAAGVQGDVTVDVVALEE